MSGQSNAQKFYDQFAPRLLKDFIYSNPRAESAIRFATRQLQITSPRAVLDLGFGIGWSSYEFARHLPFSRIDGIDLSPELTKLAQTMFGDGGKLNFECHDISDPQWVNGGNRNYEAITMLDVYEHIPRSARPCFHESLKSASSDKAIIVLTCPTPLHQNHLREHQPDGLQPVDEDVSLEDLLVLANDLDGALTHLEHKSIWSSNDYFHAVISRNLEYASSPSNPHRVKLIRSNKKLRALDRATPLVGTEMIRSIKKQAGSPFRNFARRLLKSPS